MGPIVGIVMGSHSDLPVMQNALDTLTALGIPFEARAISAHRAPDVVLEYARTAEERGLRVLIAGAGMAAALPGALAAGTLLPVIGVPLQAQALGGLDALLSISQMPPGVPVATVAVGGAGATNAAVLAAQILALSDPALGQRLAGWRAERRAKALQPLPGH